MGRCFNILLFFLFTVFVYAENRPAKESTAEMLEVIISNADNFKDLSKVVPMIVERRYIADFIPTLSPLRMTEVRITSEYGYRTDPFTGERKFHAGIDLTTSYAAFVYASAHGKVIFAGEKGGYGKCVIIQHRYGFKTIYGHLSEIRCQAGQEVDKGSIIGYLGNTGRSTANHLHFEIIKNNQHNNPIEYLCILE